MYLKFKIKCPCGSKFEVTSGQEHSNIVCPDCGKTVDESEKIRDILKLASEMPDYNELLKSGTYFISVTSDDLEGLTF